MLSGDATMDDMDEYYTHAIDAVEALEMKNMMRSEEDKMSAVVKITAGAGGTEAEDWAGMLFRMYYMWCKQDDRFNVTMVYVDIAPHGYKTVSFKVEGNFAYGFLKSENGVHRLVRVSPYNAQGKRMTSFASVFVTPLIDDTIEINILPGERWWGGTATAPFKPRCTRLLCKYP